MTVRRLDRAAAMLGVALTLTLSGSARAQLSGGQWRLSPQGGGGRSAVQVNPEPTVVVTQPGAYTLFPSQPVAFSLVPAILMSDGTVFANFGFGFEPVLRPCSGFAAVAGQSRVVGSNGVVLSQPTPPTYTQPVPNQQTTSQQMAQSAQARGGSVTVSQASQLACFGRTASGGLVAYRF